MKFKKIKECNFCGSKKLIKIFSMPKFPLTGIYLSKRKKIKNYDNDFLICEKCNHVQLKNQINPKILYNNTYTHRTSKSIMATATNQDFYKNLIQITKNKKFYNILEIGCNDLFLTKKMEKFAKNNIVGIDPIWGKKIKNFGKKITIFGGLIDKDDDFKKIKNFAKKNSIKFDLIISSHTFEHVGDFKKSLHEIRDISTKDALFVIETPSLDTIIKLKRYDQIFHQHLHYPSERSIKHLISDLNCNLIKLSYNFRIWNGNVTFAFRGKKIKKKDSNRSKKYSLIKIKNEFKNYKKNLKKKILFFKKNYPSKSIVGFGAAQMLPTIAYHSENDLSFLNSIYDDNLNRQKKFLPMIKPMIKKTHPYEISNSFVLITALDSTIPIIKRLSTIKPKLIFSLIDTF